MTMVFASREPRGADRLMLLALADNANDAGVCWPGYSTLAQKCAVDRRSAIRTIARLVKNGFVKVDQDARMNNTYHLLADNLRGDAHVTSDVHDTSDAHDTRGVTPATLLLVTPTTPEPSYNHHLTNTDKSTVRTCYAFEDFWNDYGYKVNRPKCEAKWKRIAEADKARIKGYLPEYVKRTFKDHYPTRKHPFTFLNNSSWRDELPAGETNGKPRYEGTPIFNPGAGEMDPQEWLRMKGITLDDDG